MDQNSRIIRHKGRMAGKSEIDHGPSGAEGVFIEGADERGGWVAGAAHGAVSRAAAGHSPTIAQDYRKSRNGLAISFIRIPLSFCAQFGAS